ncbi:sugar kinase [Actinomadura alba]|uniref:Sugar kinase n=1 Tax=Actinomadura alba TaxID=406431 RepID=A0ABR7LWG5_9ACTN|nr:sugar kinase [Actinomadura alba]
MNGRGLLVVGDVVTDVLVLHDARAGVETDVPADIEVRPGGSGANTAAWAASLGADVRMLARVGVDSAAWHHAHLADAGVRPVLRPDAERPTATIVVMVDPTGERTMLTDRGAGGFLGPDDWDDDLLDGVAHVHVSGYTLFTRSGAELARLVMARAHGRGITISVDPASTGFLAEFGVHRFVAATAEADVLLPNRDEALLLAGVADEVAAAAYLGGRYGLAVVKLGADGALVAGGAGDPDPVPAVPAPVLDSTGAGDAFAGGFLAARLRGAADRDAVAAGCRAGARAVSRIGGRPALDGDVRAPRH